MTRARTVFLLALLAVTNPAQAQTAKLTPASVTAFIQADEAAFDRSDWPAVQADYAGSAQTFGLYYDRAGEPHVHDGPSGTDNKTMAAFMTVRHNATASVQIGRVYIAPDGQRATASFHRISDYQQAGKHVHREFEQTAIVVLQDGEVRFAQLVSLERTP